MKVLPIIIPLIFIVMVGCSKDEEKQEQVPDNSVVAAEEEKTDNAVSEPKRSLTIELVKEKEDQENVRTGSVQESSPSAEEEMIVPLSFREKLLPLRNDNPVLPEDFEIGPLQNRFSERRDKTSVFRVITVFFNQLEKGKIEKTVVHPDWRSHVERFLWYYIRDNTVPEYFRVGSIMINEGSARANIRLFKDDGRTEGEVFLEIVEDEWLIKDIQADFSELNQDYVREEQFEPETYRWLQIQ